MNVSAGTESGDASRVVCSGAGLQGGVVGREIRSWIDTRRAGPGELAAHCTGPNKVPTYVNVLVSLSQEYRKLLHLIVEGSLIDDKLFSYIWLDWVNIGGTEYFCSFSFMRAY